MPVTLDPTVGGASANSFCSVATADAYVPSTEFDTDWEERDADVKAQKLVQATRILNNLSYYGIPASSTQALAWPRLGAYAPRGEMYSTTAIPTVLQQATAYLAAYLAAQTDAADPAKNVFSDVSQDALSSLSVGPISLSFRPGVGSPGVQWAEQVILPMLAAANLILPLGSVRLVR